jgi:hypothetical protein
VDVRRPRAGTLAITPSRVNLVAIGQAQVLKNVQERALQLTVIISKKVKECLAALDKQHFGCRALAL